MATVITWKPDDAKAMYGALFVEATIYCLFYFAMHIKDHESDLLSKKRNLSKVIIHSRGEWNQGRRR